MDKNLRLDENFKYLKNNYLIRDEKFMGKYPLGLIISEALKRTPDEDSKDKMLGAHRFNLTPPAWDWRNVNGKNYVTDVQDQEQCGSCVGFGSTATLETTLMVANQSPQMADVKRSELDLFTNIGTCAEGSTLEDANSWLVAHGTCAERCYPYNGKKQACADTTRIKILSATRITSDAAAKAWICTYGPIQGAMDVPLSLENWTGGVYKNTNNSPNMGGHCVSIIGYDDSQGCWIVKNSWGANWCEKGYFRIAYGQCNIFRGYAGYGYTVSNAPAPVPDPIPVPPVPETGDIVTSKAGTVSIMPCILGSSGLSWSLNGVNKGLIKSMVGGEYTSLGNFAQGKGLTFGLLSLAGKKYHNITVIPIVVGAIWLLLMKTTGDYTVSFLVKLE